MKQNLLTSIDRLYSDVDAVISKLVKARLDKDSIDEVAATLEMEHFMPSILQELSYLRQEIEKDGWIKVEDRLPESGIWVLISQHGVNVGLGQYINGVWRDDMDCRMDVEPTYWMPIVPPKED